MTTHAYNRHGPPCGAPFSGRTERRTTGNMLNRVLVALGESDEVVTCKRCLRIEVARMHRNITAWYDDIAVLEARLKED